MPLIFHGHLGLTILWVAVFLFCHVPEIALSSRLRSEADARKSDHGSMFVVVVAANLALLAGFAAIALFPRLAFTFHREAAFAAGLAIWIGGTLFRWYPIRCWGDSSPSMWLSRQGSG